jgi:hypothetical protein
MRYWRDMIERTQESHREESEEDGLCFAQE